MKTLLTGTEQHQRKHSIICTGVVGLVSPAASTIKLPLSVLCTNTALNGFIATMLNYQTINIPIWRDNLDSALKRFYPFVGSLYRLHVIHNGVSI